MHGRLVEGTSCWVLETSWAVGGGKVTPCRRLEQRAVMVGWKLVLPLMVGNLLGDACGHVLIGE